MNVRLFERSPGKVFRGIQDVLPLCYPGRALLASALSTKKNRAEQEALNARIDEAFFAQPETNPDASQLCG